MANFDTGWQNRTGWYLSIPYAMRVSGSVTRTDPTHIKVTGSAQLRQTSSKYAYDRINTEISGLLGWAEHKPYTSSQQANGSTYTRNFSGTFEVGTSAGTFSRTFHGRSVNSSGSGLGSDQYLDFSCGYETGATVPKGLSVSNVRTTENTVTATVSLTSWGEGANSNRYRELQVGTANNTENQYFQPVQNSDLSGDITVSPSSNKRGTISLTPNTRYYIGLYATNGALSTGSQFPGVTAVTLATASEVISSIEANKVSFAITATSGFRVPSTKVQYRKVGSSVWHESSTIQNNGNITIEGLFSYTDYEYRLAVTTTDGTWYSQVKKFKTKPNIKLIWTEGGVTKKKWVAIKMIYPDGRKRVVSRAKKVVV
ncbi:MAG: hypothetical protein ACI4TD_10960 [Phocaeicola sp.]